MLQEERNTLEKNVHYRDGTAERAAEQADSYIGLAMGTCEAT